MTVAALLLLAFQQPAVRDDRCIDCHEDQAIEVRETLHEKAGVGCVSCHGPDEFANEKHLWRPGFRRGRLPQVAELCGSCHKAVFDAFQPTGHFAAAAKDDGDPRHRSSCSACHEYHQTARASSRTILAGCVRCHAADTREVEARDFFGRLSRQGQAVTRLSDLVKRFARAPGIRTSDLDAAIEDGRTEHRAFEIAQHGLDWARLGPEADASAARVDRSYKMLAARERSFGLRYAGLGAFLGLLGLSAALIARRARTLQEHP